ncbi:MAG: SAM-dependent methyltransferase [Micavibrio aeruginosavorus]|uniref:SAM-dependent methyltransferase n=1 Tax=Micavibrio aeruginosavorus TaxID=349221 RepID=A0A2W5PIP8_9BACT|nr:MAG: SAM-dependent methyltransferase [Micavibrio aeruginosavorus]
MNSFTPNILTEKGWNDYALLDSGSGRKLERFGKIVVSRPEPQALWEKSLPEQEWAKADATFTNASEKEDDDKGSWQQKGKLPETWPVKVEGATMLCRLMTYRHMGLFPEQRPHWHWIASQCKSSTKPLKILNLFAYTGAASLICAANGAEVTHVDASKKAIGWCKENQQASNLNDSKIRWICDDAAAFVAREGRRGNKYDGILLDPPRYGRGPDGEVWKFETDVGPLLSACADLLSDDAKFMILTAYTMRLSSVTLQHMMVDALKGCKGSLDHGELLLADKTGKRPLATSMFCRWSST